jgi:site-specific recombinase XerD
MILAVFYFGQLESPMDLKTFLTTDIHQVSLDDASRTYIKYWLHTRKPVTQRWYLTRLKSLSQHLGNPTLGAIVDADLLDWATALDERSLSPYTVHGYVRAVKTFFALLTRRGLFDQNPAESLEKPFLPKGGHWGIADADAQAMLSAAQHNPRDFAILHFVRATGCRLEGVAGLLRSNIHPLDPDPAIQRQATVIEKFSKARTVFLDDAALAALVAWLAVRPTCAAPEVFVGRANHESADHRITTRSIYERFEIYASAASITGVWNPHEWRHAFGRRMAQSGMPLGLLSQIMGHESVDTTVRFYGQFAIKQLQQAFDRYR